MKIKNILLVSSLISSVFGSERQAIIIPRDVVFSYESLRYTKLYLSSIDKYKKISHHKNYKKRLKYIFHEIMNDRSESRNFLTLNKDIYEDGITFSYTFAKGYFGDLITKNEYKTLTYTDSAYKLFWSRIYSNFSS